MISLGTTARVLAIVEALSGVDNEGIAAQVLIQRSGLPPSTAYRLLTEFEEAGLIYRTADKRIHANFSFERRLTFDKISPARLTSACAQISEKLHSAAEVIVLQGQNLVWHLVKQHPAQAIRLRAHAGFVRTTYELDSITRLALAYCPMELISRRWDTTAFFEVGVAGSRVTWDDAQKKLADVDRDGMQFDLQGNAKGVRRFCVAVRDGRRILSLLTVAEAATPLRDETGHINSIKKILIEQRDAIEAAGITEPREEVEAGVA